MRVIVIGEEEAVLGFSLIGVDGRIAADAAAAARELGRALESDEAALVFVTEAASAWIAADVAAASARGAWIQVIAGPGAPAQGVAKDPEAELLSALGVKL